MSVILSMWKFTDPLIENKAQSIVSDFFVVQKSIFICSGIERREVRVGSPSFSRSEMIRSVSVLPEYPILFGDLCRLNHPDRNRLSMGIFPVAGQRLDSMAERVAVVENGAQSGFLLVLSNDRCFQRARTLLSPSAGSPCPARAVLPRFRTDKSKSAGIEYDAVFNNFSHAAQKFAFRKSVQRSNINQNGKGLIESTDEVLSSFVIDACLPPDTAVDLGQECRGNLNEWYAPQIGCSRKTSDVPDNPPAQSDDE